MIFCHKYTIVFWKGNKGNGDRKQIDNAAEKISALKNKNEFKIKFTAESDKDTFIIYCTD